MLAKQPDRNVKHGTHLSTLTATLLCTVIFLAACSSTSSTKSASHAAVTIKGHSVTDVVLTTRNVFIGNGFRLAGAETDRMVFERPATKTEQVKYGSFGSSTVVIRAKVDIQEMGPETFFLRCDVFSVRDAGQSILEDESRLMLISAKTYQGFLDEVKSRLEASNPPSTPAP
jgi:hypothetical protein